MANFTAVIDSCILYSAMLRDVLLRTASTDLFRARWSDAINQEWTNSLLENRADITPAELGRTVELMNEAVPDCLVTHYEPLIDSLKLPDPDDRHVLAAAIRCNADVIVTNNIKDFPKAVLSQFQIEVQSPDVFLGHLFDLDKISFSEAIKSHRASLKKPAMDVDVFLQMYLSNGLPITVSKLETVKELI